MNILNPIILVVSIITLLSCGGSNESNATSRELVPVPEENKKDSFVANQMDSSEYTETSQSLNKYFPFELLDIKGTYQIVAQIEAPALYPKYYDLFKKYKYEGNGVCWEGHITQILEKLDNELLKHITFDPEAGGFFAKADTKSNQIKFVQLLSPIFSNQKNLEEWIKKADRSRIDD
ncbi:Imm51 family immunity protein [Ferruginibacter sp. SUN106]|uniref:Imm51 family immunity protein n=1 Tax=Ferruginibacter sp. SUN106 TaxID=2978348 RepID=UPI003D367E81